MLGASGVTIPARLARATLMSPNWDVARARSRAMYRDWYRSGAQSCFHQANELFAEQQQADIEPLTRTTAPEIVQLYACVSFCASILQSH